MGYTVRFTPGAERDFRKLPREDAGRIKEELVALSVEEFPRMRVKKLKGSYTIPLYSFRIGTYRLILSIEDQNLVIFVLEVGDRSTIYRRH
jgi:mRNA interferase RelE/StbE